MVMSNNIIDSAVSLIEKKGTWFCVGLIGGIALAKSSPRIFGRISDFFYKKAVTPIETGAKKELNDNATENKIKIINATKDADIEKMKVRESLRRERNEERKKSSAATSELDQNVEMPPTYDDIINSTPNIDEKSLRVFIPWFHWYENLGVVGMNNTGKSTFIRQLCRSFALGHQEAKLFPEWTPGKPVKVLLFALEHNNAHIKIYDKESNASIQNWHIITGWNSISKIKAYIKKMADAAPEGLVVVIDNYTKLSEMESQQKVDELAKWMEDFKSTRFSEKKPIAYISVYHTVKNFSELNPVEFKDVRGSASYTMFSQEFISIAPCKRGSNYRILKCLKTKYLEQPQTVNVIKMVNTSTMMSEYVEEALEADELPRIGDGLSHEQPRKAGRKRRYTEEQILQMYDEVTVNGRKWKEIEKKYNISREYIYTQARAIRKRQKAQKQV